MYNLSYTIVESIPRNNVFELVLLQKQGLLYVWTRLRLALARFIKTQLYEIHIYGSFYNY